MLTYVVCKDFLKIPSENNFCIRKTWCKYMSEYFFYCIITLHCVHHDKWIFISQMRVLNTQKVYDIWYIDVDFAIIKFIDETVLFNSSLCIRGHKLSLCVLEFGLTKLAIHYLGFQLVIYCHRSLTDPLSICHISLRL